jgi:ribosomal protein S3
MEVKKMRSLLSNRTKTNTFIESVKIKSVYQSASPIAQDISFQLRNKTRSFRSIFSKIVKDIPLVMKKGVEGIRICCSGRSEVAEIGLYHWIGLLKACLQGVCVNACLLGISLLAYVLASHSSGATSFYV